METPRTGEAWTLETKPEPGSRIFGEGCRGDREPWGPTLEISVCDVLNHKSPPPPSPSRRAVGRGQQDRLESSRFLEEKQRPVWVIPPKLPQRQFPEASPIT